MSPARDGWLAPMTPTTADIVMAGAGHDSLTPTDHILVGFSPGTDHALVPRVAEALSGWSG